jgi:hypothetical protein
MHFHKHTMVSMTLGVYMPCFGMFSVSQCPQAKVLLEYLVWCYILLAAYLMEVIQLDLIILSILIYVLGSIMLIHITETKFFFSFHNYLQVFVSFNSCEVEFGFHNFNYKSLTHKICQESTPFYLVSKKCHHLDHVCLASTTTTLPFSLKNIGGQCFCCWEER